MKSSKVFDDVIQYLEKVILDGGEIDYNAISKITMSPAALFQRIFVFVSGVGIYDYVRKRKLTLAGHELKNSGISVLDAALKYGFQSHSAFSRAFKEHHGITPSEARNKTARLNDYIPINYSDMRFIGGKRIMAEMKRIVYKQIGARKIVGYYRHDASFYSGGEIWRAAFENGTFEKLKAIEGYFCEDIEDNDGIGYMFNFKDMYNFEFFIGRIVEDGAPLPDSLSERAIPPGTVAQIQIEGKDIAEILESAYILIIEAVEKTGRKIDFDNFYWCEVYTRERYCKPYNEGEKVIIDYIVPVE